MDSKNAEFEHTKKEVVSALRVAKASLDIILEMRQWPEGLIASDILVYLTHEISQLEGWEEVVTICVTKMHSRV